MTTPVPDITTPLLRDGGGENNSGIVAGLGPLAGLIGTWSSATSPPVGYNVMPLPQATAPNQFILKDFGYYEEMTFSAINASVPNRGGTYEQDAYALFYEQRVYFGQGTPAYAENTLVHAENGSWLHLVTVPQNQGAFPSPTNPDPIPSPPAPNPVPPQPAMINVVKQVSVPHGNSILATGSVQQSDVAPTIPTVSTLPTGPGVTPGFNKPFGTDDPGNPMVNPNVVLSTTDKSGAPTGQPITPAGQSITKTATFDVSTRNPGGAVTNIAFEEKRADVLAFSTTFWLETLSDGSLQLQYSQTIEMKLTQPDVTFYHIDANTMTKVN